MKTHMKDIRLSSNAGIGFPVCQANTTLLDMDKTSWKITNNIKLVTCAHCIRMQPKAYPWATKR